MNDSFQQLLQDALDYARKQPPQTWTFVSSEECQFFQSYAQNRPDRQTPKSMAGPQKELETVRPFIPISKAAPEKSLAQDNPLLKKKFAKEAEDKFEIRQGRPAVLSVKPPEEIAKTLQKIAPSLLISDQVPDDQNAKKIASGWKEKLIDIDVVLLALNNLPDTIELMKNLAKAIQKDLGPVKLISGNRLEQEKRWDLFFQINSFRLIIASDGMEHYPGLLKHYKALPTHQAAFLAHIPLIILEPASVYRSSLDQKAGLWKNLCLMLKK